MIFISFESDAMNLTPLSSFALYENDTNYL